jgi:hypothetical protein
MNDKNELYPAPIRLMLSINNEYPDDELKQAHYVNGRLCGIIGAMYEDNDYVRDTIDRILATRTSQ